MVDFLVIDWGLNDQRVLFVACDHLLKQVILDTNINYGTQENDFILYYSVISYPIEKGRQHSLRCL